MAWANEFLKEEAECMRKYLALFTLALAFQFLFTSISDSAIIHLKSGIIDTQKTSQLSNLASFSKKIRHRLFFSNAK